MNAPAPRLFGHDPAALDAAMHRIVMRAVNRREVRLLVSDARAAQRRLMEYGIYSSECQAFEDEARETRLAAIEAFHSRNEV